MKKRQTLKACLTTLSVFIAGWALIHSGYAFAADDEQTLGIVASNITKSFTAIGKLMIATAYLAGIGFGIAAIFKFKQHKDNPTQIPVGTPIALFVISMALIFLPYLFAPAGRTIFGSRTSDLQGGLTGGGVSALPGEESK